MTNYSIVGCEEKFIHLVTSSASRKFKNYEFLIQYKEQKFNIMKSQQTKKENTQDYEDKVINDLNEDEKENN